VPYLFTGHRTSIDDQVYLIGLGMDITKRKSYEDKIKFMAYHDRLTDLPSRELLYDYLSQAMSEVRRKQDRLAVFFLDLDGFKAVNDNYGHEAGDEVLKMTAIRLLACVRDDDTVARLGGDEFAIILNGIENTSDASTVAKKVIKNISEPMILQGGHECAIGVSIGISIYPENGTEIDRLLNAADSAMYESKSSGRNIYTFSTVRAHLDLDNHNWIILGKSHLFGIPEIDQDHLELVSILNKLNAAVSGNEPTEVTIRLLDKLSEQIRSNFQYEDLLMIQYGYSDTNAHKNEHQRLIDELDYLKNKFNQNGEMVVLFALKEWLLKHIANYDRLLCDFILKQRVK
jgi:diguanylate cyclase (GGDEF)-like protein/hemerythrin-like metal-binding protein